MTSQRRLLLALSVAWVGMALGCAESGTKAEPSHQEAANPAKPDQHREPSLAPPDKPANPVQPDQPKPDQHRELPWSSPANAVTQCDLRVQIAKTAIGKVPLKDALREGATSKDDLLMVKLDLLNTNPTKKLEYLSWAGNDSSPGCACATLKDNFGNGYKLAGFGPGSSPVGAATSSQSLYPNKPVTDVLVFEAPLDAATHLDLELPARNFGGEGVVRFRIPMQLVRATTAADSKAEAARKAERLNAAVAGLLELKARLVAAQNEAANAEQQAKQAVKEAVDAAQKAGIAYRNSGGDSSPRPAAAAGSAEAASRVQDYRDSLQADLEASRAKEYAKKVIERTKEIEARARQTAKTLAELQAAYRHKEASMTEAERVEAARREEEQRKANAEAQLRSRQERYKANAKAEAEAEAKHKEQLARREAEGKEKRAASYLEYALKLKFQAKDDGDEERAKDAKRRLEEVVEKFPGTKAAAEAKQILRTMTEKP